MADNTDLNDFMLLIKPELKQVDELILKELNSDIALINQLGSYLIQNGGKRVRPFMTILSAKAIGYEGNAHLLAAAFIEFIHTATLLHDDVVDESSLRRGKATANVLFGNASSVLVGDYIYTRAFQMMVRTNSLEILKIMSLATNVIAEGEVQQLLNCNNPDLTIDEYFEIIYRKTARLFEVSSQIPAILHQSSPEIEFALQEYGKFVGTAFQLMDDLLDYSAADAQKLGKKLGDDLNEGKATLPLLHAMHHTKNESDRDLIREAIKKGNGRDLLDQVLGIMDTTDSLNFTRKLANQESIKAIKAIEILPDSIYKNGLICLANSASQRKF